MMRHGDGEIERCALELNETAAVNLNDGRRERKREVCDAPLEIMNE